MACLSENEALAFIKGETRAEGASQVEDHVAGCSECQALLGMMVEHSLIDTPSETDDSGSLIGRRVGNFVITGLLGKGGMGEVYLATHPEIGRQVAVKVLAVPVPEHAQRFLNEARVMAALRHPNVVEVHDFGQLEHGRPYYVMELLRGPSLADVIRERAPMSPSEALRYLEPICAGLQAAHDAGVVHRDLKPANIIVLEAELEAASFQVKLVDFGLAKLTRSAVPASNIESTTPGLVMGTPQFLAPEQATGEPERIGPPTDIYALGIVLHWMLSGKAPFVANTPSSVIAQHLGKPPPPLTGLPPGVARIVERCLAKNPEDRPARAQGVVDAFRAAIGAPRTAQRWLVAAIGAAILAAAAVIWGATRQPDARPQQQRENVPSKAVASGAMEEPKQPITSTHEPDASAPSRRRPVVEKTRRPRRRRARGRRSKAPKPSPTKRRARVGEGTLPFQ
jgi:serine/threonine-protein kinase